MSKLILCAGERHEPGFLTHDVQKFENTHYVCDLYDFLTLYPETKGTMTEIHFTHALEHFPMNDSIKVLQMIKKLLTPDGRLYIEVPNLYWNAEEIVRNPRARQNVEYIFGGQLNKWDFHYNGYTPEILSDDLKEAGYKVLELKPCSSIECWAQNNG